LSDVTEDLQILYRAVSRRQGRSIDYAGCVTADEALRLQQMGLAKIVDVQAEGDRADDETDGSDADQQPIPGAIRVCLRASERGGTTVPERDRAKPSMIDSLRLLAGNNDILMFLSKDCDDSHAAASQAAKEGFYCVLNVIDGRECYRRSSPS